MSFAHVVSQANRNATDLRYFPLVSCRAEICLDFAIKSIKIDEPSLKQLNSV